MNIQTVKFNNTSFVNVVRPGDLEIKYLINNFEFSKLHLEDYLHRSHVPKIETFKNYSLIVLDFPAFETNGQNIMPKTNNGKHSAWDVLHVSPPPLTSLPLLQFSSGEKRKVITSSQVVFFIGKDFLVVLHSSRLSPINEIFSLCQKALKYRNDFLGQGPVFLAYKIIDSLVDASFLTVNEITAMIDKIDRQFEDRWARNPLEETSLTRRNIVVFHTTIKPSLTLFRELSEGEHKELNDMMKPYWSNILNHLQRVWYRLEDCRELIEGISESNESLIAAKTNQIVMVLTIFSAIILPLNLLASIYGMNIQTLPYAGEPFSFTLLFGIMAVVAISMLLVFKWRRWF